MHPTLLHWADGTVSGRRGVRGHGSREVRTPERYGDSGKRLARPWRRMLTGNPESWEGLPTFQIRGKQGF